MNEDTALLKSRVVCLFFNSMPLIYLALLYTWLFLVSLLKQVVDWKVGRLIFWSPKEVQRPARSCGNAANTSIKILLSLHYFLCRGETTLLCLIDKTILEVIAFLDCWSWSIRASCWDNTIESSTSAIDIIRRYSRVDTIRQKQRTE